MDEKEKTDILIFSASYGGGHRRVSYSVKEAINILNGTIKASVIDLFEHISPRLNRLNANAYVTTMRNLPQLYGLVYGLTYDFPLNNFLNRMLSKIGIKKLRDLINELKPEVVLSTYPTYGGILSELKKRGEVDVISAVVITDFVAHSQWIHPLVDQYFVASDEVRYCLIKKGIPPDTIQTTGIPISKDFLLPIDKIDKDDVFKEYGLKNDIPVILIMAGLFGMTRGVMEICEVIKELPINLQTVVLCGKDKKLFDELSAAFSEDTAIKPLLSQTDVYKLMGIASILISKSGGITVSEALAKELPIVVYKPLHGQEYHNALFLSKTGAGIIVNNKGELKNILTALLTDIKHISRMKESARIVKKPEASADVAKRLISLKEKGRKDKSH